MKEPLHGNAAPHKLCLRRFIRFVPGSLSRLPSSKAAYLPEIAADGGSPRCPPQNPDKSAIWKSVTNTSMCGRSSGAEPSSSHPPPALIASIASSPQIGSTRDLNHESR